ncbi:MAG: hypothetical protein M1827_001534 [Pycnora praestabilis]|nr:MAG: hypothetical protein M1827_001534 [Pycnora praestabilis]
MSPQGDDYTEPDDYANLDEVAAPPPVENSEDNPIHRHESLEEYRSGGEDDERSRSRQPQGAIEDLEGGEGNSREDYDVPDDYANLDELAGPSPVENPSESRFFRRNTLEEVREKEQSYLTDEEKEKKGQACRKPQAGSGGPPDGDGKEENSTGASGTPSIKHEDHSEASQRKRGSVSPTSSQTVQEGEKKSGRRERASKYATQLYTISYLVFFSLLGTLARLGLQALTFYPGAPAQTGVLWANFGGTVILGFLSEDRKLFKEEWGKKVVHEKEKKERTVDEEEHDDGQHSEESEADIEAIRKAHSSVKKTIPLFIGLATGFCGSFTSFSSFIRDVFFALSNDLPTPISHTSTAPIASSSTVHRNGGYDVMALLAVILLTLCLCLAGLQLGAHIAIVLEPITPTLPFFATRKFFDRSIVMVAWLSWLGAIFLAIWPPDRPGGPDGQSSWLQETWRGEVIFALVFAPIGCLVRFYASLHLNGRIASFPLGTFTVNILGTAILGMCYDLQHAGSGSASGMIGGGMVGCQVLQGVQDGFCGCVTTVSTWVTELKGLRRRHAYFYGTMSVGVALALLVVEMGSLRWTKGFASPVCVT